MSTRSEEQHSIHDAETQGDDEPKPALPVPHLAACELAIKRVIDIVVSLIAMLVFIPLALIVAIVIKLNSKGPVFFKQARVGRNGSLFTLYKFRSMHQNADRIKQSLGHMNEAEGPVFKIKRDPRITRVGAILRKTSLDELPQFINVLRGEMSLVGPRPPLPQEVERYTDYQRGRLAVKPGLTCLWQVQGRSSVSFDRWVELDLEYIRRQSLWLDLTILLKTIPAVLKGTGAW
jgi:exopolysaccharide biosynthesis polyprenyl glycosylphosphotransferase